MVKMKQIIHFFIVLLLINEIQSRPEPDYHKYLEQFGYTPRVEGLLLAARIKPSANEGIRKFQQLYKLPETGVLDESTKKLMQRPRCGNPDIGKFNTMENNARIAKLETSLSNEMKNAPASFEVHTVKWPKKHLKWFISKFPEKQSELKSKDHVRQILHQAFLDWEKHSGLRFEMVKTQDAADLVIEFHTSDHQDGYPFDGQGATLAHAFYPTDGKIHFDDDETFTDNYNTVDNKYTLRLVAAHEIGHALGLSHSFEENSLMYPVYQQFDPDYTISTDDQHGIQNLYGTINEKTTDTTTDTSEVTTPSNWCYREFQTGCEGPDRELYLFTNGEVWRYFGRTKHMWDSKPTSISQRFPPLKDIKITSCVKSLSGYTYFFDRRNMWKAKTHWSIEGPDRLDAKNFPQNSRVALYHNNSIYFLQDHLAYALIEDDHHKELRTYPIQAMLDPAPKEPIHSGFTYGKRHYIFTQKHVYVYDSTDGDLLSGYPKPKVTGWFACDTTKDVSQWKKKIAKPFRNENFRDRYQDHHHSYHHHRHDHDDRYRERHRPHNPSRYGQQYHTDHRHY